jgi:hypothetical protein
VHGTASRFGVVTPSSYFGAYAESSKDVSLAKSGNRAHQISNTTLSFQDFLKGDNLKPLSRALRGTFPSSYVCRLTVDAVVSLAACIGRVLERPDFSPAC